jgi:hypothetical protein
MDKKISIIFIAFIFAILLAVGISSAKVSNSKSFSIKIVEKNPNNNNWSIIKNGAYGQIFFSKGNNLLFTGFKLKPNSGYTLIYYGYDGFNDAWANATCIKNAVTNKYGRLRDIGTFDYTGFIKDNIPQKFWVIQSSDVDCDNHKMIAWNPTEYLFEMQTI